MHSIHEVVRTTGLTSRTLRHYDRIGLLRPTTTGPGGLRHYDRAALVRLQRILLWRELGIPLARIKELLAGQTDDLLALREQRESLERESARINDQRRAVDTTIAALENGETLMPEEMFNGFDHTVYDAEVRERWGDEAADRSNRWWEGLGEPEKDGFRREVAHLNSSWDDVIASGAPPTSPAAQQVAARHLAWLRSAWQGRELTAEVVRDLADMYVADPRFAKNYTRRSPEGARFVRDALHHHVEVAGV
ncbi:MerR family transcriptional regulator [Pseudactinotalea sp. HY158]|uniref:MerR family transcriptional regulator n=1 Tax=Pseudactinotalea sp. HY158 TaxID=2654547 RepID=UPI00129CB149|nr:MerR family transcriptional regulator [Pseudactinotalea sp. HY158]QGH69722.1 MerR family transcriptional regulator [Pseudactinotalea sp. HY158]